MFFAQPRRRSRPLTHDLIGHIFNGLGTTVERVVINDLKNSTYFARLILRTENELGKKILEIDARPSDCIALAVLRKAPSMSPTKCSMPSRTCRKCSSG